MRGKNRQVSRTQHTLNPTSVAPGITSLPKSFAEGNFSRRSQSITSLLKTYIPILAMYGNSLALSGSRPRIVVSTCEMKTREKQLRQPNYRSK
jgi:hypothetical protein